MVSAPSRSPSRKILRNAMVTADFGRSQLLDSTARSVPVRRNGGVLSVFALFSGFLSRNETREKTLRVTQFRFSRVGEKEAASRRVRRFAGQWRFHCSATRTVNSNIGLLLHRKGKWPFCS